MLFKWDGLTSIYIHTPKTGGNTIQREFIDRKIALDKLITKKHQNKTDRFEIKGEFTKYKHQPLFKYYEANPDLISARVFASVRKPFERLISLYFSPNKWMKFNFFKRKWIANKKPIFKEKEFIKIIKEEKSAFQMLYPKTNIDNNAQRDFIKKKVNVIKMESLNSDFYKFFGFEISSYRNKGLYLEQINTLLGSKDLRKLVEESHHIKDLESFYN